MASRRWMLPLKVAANVLVLGGVAYLFATSFEGREAEVLESVRAIRPGLLAAILVLGFAFNLVLHHAWYVVTRRLHIDVPYGQSLAIWMFSTLGKYVPGKVMLLISRTWFYRQRGKSPIWVGYGVVLEHLFALAAAVLIFLLALGTTDVPAVKPYRLLGLLGLGGLLIFLSPRFLNWATALAARRLKIPARPPLRLGDFLAILGMFLLAWLWLGLGNFLLIQALSGVGWEYFLYLTGAHALAGIVGVLALFAPTGIGVKEGMLFFLLSRIMPPYQATLATLALRVWLTATELSLGALGWLLSRRLRGSPPEAETSQRRSP
jgi:hypothetical protein